MIPDVIVLFGSTELAGEVGTLEKLGKSVMMMGEYSSDACIGSVHFNNEWLVWVNMMEDGCSGKASFEVFEGLDSCQGPGEPRPLSSAWMSVVLTPLIKCL